MPQSDYVRSLRAAVGQRLLLLPAVAAVIRDPEGRVLVQKRADDGRWSLPAGAIDPGETPAQALIREVREETGLWVLPRTLLGVFGGIRGRMRYPNGDEVEGTNLVFACEVTGGDFGGRDGETAQLRYFSLDEMPPLLTDFPLRELLAPGRTGAYFEAAG